MSFDQGKVVYHKDSFERLHDPWLISVVCA